MAFGYCDGLAGREVVLSWDLGSNGMNPGNLSCEITKVSDGAFGSTLSLVTPNVLLSNLEYDVGEMLR